MTDNTQPEHKPGVYEAEQFYRHLNPGPEDALRDILTELQSIRRLLERTQANAVYTICQHCGQAFRVGDTHACSRTTTW